MVPKERKARSFVWLLGALGLCWAARPVGAQEEHAGLPPRGPLGSGTLPPQDSQDDDGGLFASLDALLARTGKAADGISLGLRPGRRIVLEAPNARGRAEPATILRYLSEKDRYLVRLEGRTLDFPAATLREQLRELNLPYVVEDGSRALPGRSPRDGAVIVIDRAADPALRIFLQEARALGRDPFESDLSKIRKVTDLVNERIRYPGRGVPGGEYERFEATHRGREVPLGHYLETGVGVCRHKALALKLALEALGYPSRYVVGEVRSPGRPVALHAWVEATTRRGQRLVIDPTWHQPGLTLERAYGSRSGRRPSSGGRWILPPGAEEAHTMGELTAAQLDPFRRPDGTVRWRRVLADRAAREVGGLGRFGLGLFLKELAVVIRSGDRARMDEFFAALANSDFYAEYGAFALGARVGETAYKRFLERCVRPGFVGELLRGNAILASGLALPWIASGEGDARAFAIRLGTLGLSSAAVASGARTLQWVSELRVGDRSVGPPARGLIPRVGGFVYQAAGLAVVLYFAEAIEAEVVAWREEREAREALAKAGLRFLRALSDSRLDREQVEVEAARYGEAWDSYRRWLLRPLLEGEERLARRLDRASRRAQRSEGRRRATRRLADFPHLAAWAEERAGSLERYAAELGARGDAAIRDDLEAALEHYRRTRDDALRRLYDGPRRQGAYLEGLEGVEALAAGVAGREGFFARLDRERLEARWREALAHPSRNKLQTYEDQREVLLAARAALAGRGDLALGLEDALARVDREAAFDRRLARAAGFGGPASRSGLVGRLGEGPAAR